VHHVDRSAATQTGGSIDPLPVRAERLLDVVMAEPGRARSQAAALLARARATGDDEAAGVLARVLGLAARAAGDVAEAARQLRRSIALAEAGGRAARAAESRMSLALVLDDLGHPGQAVREIDRAAAVLRGRARARAVMQRAIILRRLGRDDEALEGYGRALASFRRAGDRLGQARALTNRGVLYAYQGKVRQAGADLHAAAELYAALGQHTALAQVRHNLGFVAAQAGDVPAALRWYDRADAYFRRHGRPAEAVIDRAELLLDARLWPEARQAAETAIEVCQRSGTLALLPRARLLRAQAALATGDLATARDCARTARTGFRRQRQHRWAALADFVIWQAAPRPGSVAAARALARTLDAAGWDAPAMEIRLAAAVRPPGRRDGDHAAAMADLAAAVASPCPTDPARVRARVWYGRALVRLQAGDRAGAKRALIAALRVVDEYRAAFGAAELRVHSSAEGTRTALLGVRLAAEDGRPREMLAWAERSRAAALRLGPPAPPSAAMTRDLAQLRQVVARISTVDDPARLTHLLRRQRALEDAVRRRTWSVAGRGGLSRGPSVADLCATLAAGEPTALLELVDLDDRLVGLVAVDGRVTARPLAAVAEVATEVAALRFALRRLVLRHGSAASLATARSALTHAAARLDELLLAPVRPLLGDRRLVIVPTGALHSLPWSVLPSCRGRPVTLAPSAALWRDAATRPPAGDGRVVLVAAPSPPYVEEEVVAIGASRPAAVRLSGVDARVPPVLAALDGADIAHIAAHGIFRADNPMFSHLSLADGPLTVYDLQQVRHPPRLMVLSACDAGRSAVFAGDELMGLAAAILGLGTRTLIASVCPVDDEAASGLMVDLYRRLRAGARPAEALAAARAEADATAATAGFVCFGAG
jgi:tetratricopeptide (TPR) repeat protein